MASDESLMVAVAGGDGDAFAELVRRFERPLHRFLARQTGDRDVEDLHQETWLRVVRAAGSFDGTRRFSTWLFQIAVNLARDWRRRPPPVTVEPDVAAEQPAPAAASDARLDAARLLQSLPEAQRAVLILRYYHDLPEDEVAAILGCAPGTVKSRLHYALERLTALTRETPR